MTIKEMKARIKHIENEAKMPRNANKHLEFSTMQRRLNKNKHNYIRPNALKSEIVEHLRSMEEAYKIVIEEVK